MDLFYKVLPGGKVGLCFVSPEKHFLKAISSGHGNYSSKWLYRFRDIVENGYFKRWTEKATVRELREVDEAEFEKIEDKLDEARAKLRKLQRAHRKERLKYTKVQADVPDGASFRQSQEILSAEAEVTACQEKVNAATDLPVQWVDREIEPPINLQGVQSPPFPCSEPVGVWHHVHVL